MSNPYRGEVDLEFAGKKITLRPDMTAIMEWEEATKRGTMALAASLERGEIRTVEVAEVILAAAKAGGANLTRRDVLGEIEAAGIHVFYIPAQMLLNRAFFGGATPKEGKQEKKETSPATTESSSAA